MTDKTLTKGMFPAIRSAAISVVVHGWNRSELFDGPVEDRSAAKINLNYLGLLASYPIHRVTKTVDDIFKIVPIVSLVCDKSHIFDSLFHRML